MLDVKSFNIHSLFILCFDKTTTKIRKIYMVVKLIKKNCFHLAAYVCVFLLTFYHLWLSILASFYEPTVQYNKRAFCSNVTEIHYPRLLITFTLSFPSRYPHSYRGQCYLNHPFFLCYINDLTSLLLSCIAIMLFCWLRTGLKL